MGSEPPVLDPQVADTGVSVFVLRQIVSTLFNYDPKQGVIAADAESFEWVNGGKVLHVKIREGLRWSDGQSLTACQFRDGLLHALDPQLPAPLSEILFDIAGAADRKGGRVDESKVGIRCDDAKRDIEIDTLVPQSVRLLYALSFVVSAPIRKEVVARRATAWMLPEGGQPGLSSGAYCLAEWTHDRRVKLVARSLHEKNLATDLQAHISEVDMPIVRDPATALAMYKNGELDVLDEIPPQLMPSLKNHPDLVSAPSPTTYMVGFSFRANPVLKDKRVRRALALAAHQDEVPLLLGGAGEEAGKGWVPPQLLPVEIRPTRSLYKPEEAKKLLSEAGFKDRAKFPMLKLFYNAGERHQLLMERLANNWQTTLGIQVELNPIEWKMLVSRLKTQPPDLYRYAWTAVYPDASFFLSLFTSQSQNNFGKWANKEYDELFLRISKVPFEKRDARFWQDVARAQSILVEEDPALIPIYHYVKNALVSRTLSGLSYDAQGMSPLRLVKLAR